MRSTTLIRKLTYVSAVAAALGVCAPAVADSPAQTPTPPSAESCNGLVIATGNHLSGIGGASGNDNASAGPGYFVGPFTPVVIDRARELFR